MNLNGLQKAYMRKLKPIQKAIYTFSLIGLQSKDPLEKKLLMKIAQVCEEASESDEPLLQAGKNLSLMLVTDNLSIEEKSSVLSAIDVLEKIRENYIAENN